MRHAGDSQCWDFQGHPVTRRDMLKRSGIGLAATAFQFLLTQDSRSAIVQNEHSPLSPKIPMIPARAKRVIFMFMHGGPSQVDTFDYKPLLQRDHGKPFPGKKPRIQSGKTGNLLASPWEFRQYGQSGIHVSDLFPQVGSIVDDLCILNSVYGSNSRHGGALLELHTGSDTFVRPSMGSWITYGLGSENQDLPGFITICPTLGHGGVNAWSSSFLPAHFQGTPIGTSRTPAEKAKVPFIQGQSISTESQRLELDALREMNRAHLDQSGPDDQLESRIESFELAFRMQREIPDIQNLQGESEATRKSYGIDKDPTRNFGIQCLLARRFAEAGVRFIQVTHSYKWDQHGDLKRSHARNAREVDQPIAALITDLKNRGLLEDTLILWGGEFGRTPTEQGNKDGRDHNPHANSMFMAGGGIKPGLRYGLTDDYGYYAVEDKIHFHDLHATILHLMGLDHEALTYRFAGRDFRLTDVHGKVVSDIIS